MPLNYELNDRINIVLTSQDEYIRWFTAFSRRIVCEEYSEALSLQKPNFFIKSLSEDALATFNEKQIGVINKKNEALFEFADKGVHDLCEGNVQSLTGDFVAFTELFDWFMRDVSQLRRSVFYEENGYDKLTGLKSASSMFKELEIELERVSRQGKDFSMAMAMIVDYEEVKEHLGAEQLDEHIHLAARVIKKCLRPFDDAYYSRNNEFVMALKQTGAGGAIRAFNRLEGEFEKEAASYVANGETKKVSMTCCIAEPVPGDDVSILLDNLREDIKSSNGTSGNAFSYNEISPLQRLIKQDTPQK